MEPTAHSEELDLDQLARLVTPRTRLISLVHVSNMLGCIADVPRIVEIAQGVGAKVGRAGAGAGWARARAGGGYAAGRSARASICLCRVVVERGARWLAFAA